VEADARRTRETLYQFFLVGSVFLGVEIRNEKNKLHFKIGPNIE
jgi:hypothetical protein